MRLTESQIRKIVRNEVFKGKTLKEGASMSDYSALIAAFSAFMHAGGTLDELLNSAQEFVDDWYDNDPDTMSIDTFGSGSPRRGYGRDGTIADND